MSAFLTCIKYYIIIYLYIYYYILFMGHLLKFNPNPIIFIVSTLLFQHVNTDKSILVQSLA